jgi:hypothetical protein
MVSLFHARSKSKKEKQLGYQKTNCSFSKTEYIFGPPKLKTIIKARRDNKINESRLAKIPSNDLMCVE